MGTVVTYRCENCGKPYNPNGKDGWFRNELGQDLHACPAGEMGTGMGTGAKVESAGKVEPKKPPKPSVDLKADLAVPPLRVENIENAVVKVALYRYLCEQLLDYVRKGVPAGIAGILGLLENVNDGRFKIKDLSDVTAMGYTIVEVERNNCLKCDPHNEHDAVLSNWQTLRGRDGNTAMMIPILANADDRKTAEKLFPLNCEKPFVIAVKLPESEQTEYTYALDLDKMAPMTTGPPHHIPLYRPLFQNVPVPLNYPRFA